MNITIKGRVDGDTHDIDIDLTMRPGAVVLIDGANIEELKTIIADLTDDLEDAKAELRR
jgi:hypothetical protein